MPGSEVGGALVTMTSIPELTDEQLARKHLVLGQIESGVSSGAPNKATSFGPYTVDIMRPPSP